MDPSPRARLAAALGLLSMFTATAGCVSCGLGYAAAVPIAIVGWMAGRAAVRIEIDEDRGQSETAAWGRIGMWSSALGGVFSALVLATALLWLVGWSLGLTTLASL